MSTNFLYSVYRQARIASDLKDLRDQSVFAFFMLNALFVLIVFLMQLNKDELHIKWPFGIKTNITYDESSQEVKTAPRDSPTPPQISSEQFCRDLGNTVSAEVTVGLLLHH